MLGQFFLLEFLSHVVNEYAEQLNNILLPALFPTADVLLLEPSGKLTAQVPEIGTNPGGLLVLVIRLYWWFLDAGQRFAQSNYTLLLFDTRAERKYGKHQPSFFMSDQKGWNRCF